jgi:hypothetical protein
MKTQPISKTSFQIHRHRRILSPIKKGTRRQLFPSIFVIYR